MRAHPRPLSLKASYSPGKVNYIHVSSRTFGLPVAKEDDVAQRVGPAEKDRGAFFTPPKIADYLAEWAVAGNPTATVLDPTCGEAVFLLGAGRALRKLNGGAAPAEQLIGIDIHQRSLDEASSLLEAEEMGARFICQDFFATPAPGEPECVLAPVDAVVGNPPFVRYQLHNGEVRQRSLRAALRQGVRLSGLASSWAAVLVHASGFLKSDGRLAMVLPAELLTVNYAEPVRRWLKERFAAVHLVMFERLQFEGALEKVVLLIAQGTGGCDAFALWNLTDAGELATVHGFDSVPVTPADDGKWTAFLLPNQQRQLFKSVSDKSFVSLRDYGTPELGTVTGANAFFAIRESVRTEYRLPSSVLAPISPPGTRHLRGASFTKRDWERLRDLDEPVWLLHPDPDDRSEALMRYVEAGERRQVNSAYKCSIREPWWRPPMVAPPDFFFTYMSHRFPRIIVNHARVSLLNSMHGIRMREGMPKPVRAALPLLALNSVTMIGAEVFGRSYGGGILKMEPREAGRLPVPESGVLEEAWARLRREKSSLDRQLRAGRWTSVLAKVDDILLRQTLGLSGDAVTQLHEAARRLREQRLGPEVGTGGVSEHRERSGSSG